MRARVHVSQPRKRTITAAAAAEAVIASTLTVPLMQGPVRGRLTRYTEHHHLAWETAMALLAIVYLVFGLLLDDNVGAPAVVVAVLGVVFFLEFSLRLWDSPSRRSYLRAHWLDLVSCLPLVGGLRSLRLLRLVRLGGAARLVRVVGDEVDRRQRDRSSLWFLAPLLIVVWFVAAAAYWSFERGVDPAVHSFADALYWAFITSTTMGYGDTVPVSPEARLLAGLLIFVGIGLLGFASAQLTHRLLRQRDDDVTTGDVDLADRIAGLEREIARLTAVVQQAVSASPQPRTDSPPLVDAVLRETAPRQLV